ncbi:hypothetical protein KI387_004770, partial [Taxus chinensis]
MLHKQGIAGPPPRFLLGNLLDMKKIKEEFMEKSPHNTGITSVRHDIGPLLFPHFVQWSRVYGKTFVFWLGTEPFLYVRDPELFKKTSLSRSLDWGKPDVLKNDKVSLFGNGLIMADGKDWAHHRRIVSPAFHMDKIKGMIGDMVESTIPMLERWRNTVIGGGGSADIDIDEDITKVTADIIAKTSFGTSYEKGKQVFASLRTLQYFLYKPNRFLGVPGSRFINGKVHSTAKKLGEETDKLLMSIITARRKLQSSGDFGNDLLGLILAENESDEGKQKLTTRDLMDECKTFFLAGHESTAMSAMWTMMLLSLNPNWQERIRTEVMEITQGRIPDAEMLFKMKNMSMVLSESMRLYPAASYTLRQAKQDMQMGDILVPKGTSVWFDILGLHHDPDLWGADVNEFKPERFEFGISNACNHSMSFLPFGFGQRVCVAQNMANIE